MKISQQGLDLIVEREGKRNTAYLDTADPPVWTIGVGHTGPEVHAGLVWTDAQVMQALRSDIERFEKAINDAVKVPLEQFEFDALVSWAFNVGDGAAKSSTLVKYLNLGNREAAANQFDRWHIPPSITSRRNAEREQFKGERFEARVA